MTTLFCPHCGAGLPSTSTTSTQVCGKCRTELLVRGNAVVVAGGKNLAKPPALAGPVAPPQLPRPTPLLPPVVPPMAPLNASAPLPPSSAIASPPVAAVPLPPAVPSTSKPPGVLPRTSTGSTPPIVEPQPNVPPTLASKPQQPADSISRKKSSTETVSKQAAKSERKDASTSGATGQKSRSESGKHDAEAKRQHSAASEHKSASESADDPTQKKSRPGSSRSKESRASPAERAAVLPPATDLLPAAADILPPVISGATKSVGPPGLAADLAPTSAESELLPPPVEPGYSPAAIDGAPPVTAEQTDEESEEEIRQILIPSEEGFVAVAENITRVNYRSQKVGLRNVSHEERHAKRRIRSALVFAACLIFLTILVILLKSLLE